MPEGLCVLPFAVTAFRVAVPEPPVPAVAVWVWAGSWVESKVTVLEAEEDDFDFRIYMNNILDHRGYKFFQASFDPDEKGTVLSVDK